MCTTRLKRHSKTAYPYPTQPQNFIEQTIATSSAIAREAAGPEYHIKSRYFSWLSPPPLGRSLIILTYWAAIIYMLVGRSAVVSGAYYYEKLGFRAAWVSITQVPLVYLLATKSSILGVFTGTSHERLNWAHRWVSRTLLLTATIHGGMFYRQWDRVDYVADELEMMPMVKYGMGAWFILVWTFLSSLTPMRSWWYEGFVIQHIAAAAVLLWCLWMHVPDYAFYNVWFAVATICVDKLVIWGWTTYNNVSMPKKCAESQVLGHRADIKALDGELTEVTIHDVKFQWEAGQHVYLRLPTISLNPLEAHPFTIANAPIHSSSQSIQLLIEKKGGFTKRLHTKAQSASTPVTAILTGPLGKPPTWKAFETLVMISASTGITFTLPILESIIAPNLCQATLNNAKTGCVRRIDFLHVVRKKHATKGYIERLEQALVKAEQAGVELRIRVAVTCERCGCCGNNCQCHNFCNPPAQPQVLEGTTQGSNPEKDTDTISMIGGSEESASSSMEKKPLPTDAITERSGTPKTNSTLSTPPGSVAPRLTTRQPVLQNVLWTSNRPNIEEWIRNAVEATGGETMVAVCGGKSLVACVRTTTAALSDERGVHKGTGAQGISVWSEHYCF